MTQAKGWHAEDVKAALRKQFGSLAALSASWGYHPRTLSGAVTGGSPSSVIERRIAEALRLPPHTLWPDRWSPEGVPLPSRKDHSARPRRANRQIEKAA